jgi:pimeloyl-ACP methyl ester carboxylesterase
MIWSADDIIFPRHAVPSAGPVPRGSAQLQVKTADGETLHGVHIKPVEETGARTLVLGFGGNAWNGQDVATYLHQLYPENDVVAFHYRGYRPSTGTPSAETLIADAPAVFDAAIKQVRPERTVAVGFSIGSGIAATLVKSRKLDGLILVTPFDSLKASAQSLYPWLPVGLFFHHEIDAGAALRKSAVPTAIVAAERDEIIPPVRTEALRPVVGNLVFDRTIAGAGHNDIYGRDDFHDAMREALDSLAKN